jgi:hypothetical protein
MSVIPIGTKVVSRSLEDIVLEGDKLKIISTSDGRIFLFDKNELPDTEVEIKNKLDKVIELLGLLVKGLNPSNLQDTETSNGA